MKTTVIKSFQGKIYHFYQLLNLKMLNVNVQCVSGVPQIKWVGKAEQESYFTLEVILQ